MSSRWPLPGALPAAQLALWNSAIVTVTINGWMVTERSRSAMTALGREKLTVRHCSLVVSRWWWAFWSW